MTIQWIHRNGLLENRVLNKFKARADSAKIFRNNGRAYLPLEATIGHSDSLRYVIKFVADMDEAVKFYWICSQMPSWTIPPTLLF